jgi:hypothetical protein
LFFLVQINDGGELGGAAKSMEDLDKLVDESWDERGAPIRRSTRRALGVQYKR